VGFRRRGVTLGGGEKNRGWMRRTAYHQAVTKLQEENQREDETFCRKSRGGFKKRKSNKKEHGRMGGRRAGCGTEKQSGHGPVKREFLPKGTSMQT